MQGHVYVLSNVAMPGLIKVGKTTRDVATRAGDLSSATGVPVAFQIEKSYEVVDCDLAEKFAHEVLERAVGRSNDKREFFNGPLEVVISILDDALAGMLHRPDQDAIVAQFQEAFRRLARKEFTMGRVEFETNLRDLPSSPILYVTNAALRRVLGGYLACCVATNQAPMLQHCILEPRVKGEVMEHALKALRDTFGDPEVAVIEYMRLLH